MEKEKISVKEKWLASFQNRKFQGGAYTSVISVIVIVAVILVNLFVDRMEVEVDLTSSGKYSLTEETVAMLESLEDEITIYYLASSGSSIPWFDTIFSKYVKYGKNIELVTVDPIMNPTFAAQYTEEQISECSVIVVNETDGRSRYVDYEDMMIIEYAMDYNTYSYTSTVTGLDVEGQLNSAILYVTADNLPKLYAVTGHGEIELGSAMQSMLTKSNYSYETLELMKTEEIPADCDVLFIGAPETDYTENELETILNYVENGGNLIILAAYITTDHTNFNQLLTQFGVSATEGIVVEGNSNYYMARYANYLLPNVSAVSEITDSISDNKYILAPITTGLTLDEELREGLASIVLLTTSKSAYSKVNTNAATYSKEEGDIDGPFYVGLHMTDTANNSQAVIFSSYFMFDDTYVGEESFANVELLINSIAVMAEVEQTTSVRTISLEDEEYVTLTSAQSNGIGFVVVILLPISLLTAGIVMVIKRRRL